MFDFYLKINLKKIARTVNSIRTAKNGRKNKTRFIRALSQTESIFHMWLYVFVNGKLFLLTLAQFWTGIPADGRLIRRIRRKIEDRRWTRMRGFHSLMRAQLLANTRQDICALIFPKRHSLVQDRLVTWCAPCSSSWIH